MAAEQERPVHRVEIVGPVKVIPDPATVYPGASVRPDISGGTAVPPVTPQPPPPGPEPGWATRLTAGIDRLNEKFDKFDRAAERRNGWTGYPPYPPAQDNGLGVLAVIGLVAGMAALLIGVYLLASIGKTASEAVPAKQEVTLKGDVNVKVEHKVVPPEVAVTPPVPVPQHCEMVPDERYWTGYVWKYIYKQVCKPYPL